jgi:4-oxalocrotonate tautomerase
MYLSICRTGCPESGIIPDEVPVRYKPSDFFKNNGINPFNPMRLLRRRINTGSGTIMPVIVLHMKQGASTEQKRRIVKEFTDTLVSTLGIGPEMITILIEDLPLENIGRAGKLRCD